MVAVAERIRRILRRPSFSFVRRQANLVPLGAPAAHRTLRRRPRSLPCLQAMSAKIHCNLRCLTRKRSALVHLPDIGRYPSCLLLSSLLQVHPSIDTTRGCVRREDRILIPNISFGSDPFSIPEHNASNFDPYSRQ